MERYLRGTCPHSAMAQNKPQHGLGTSIDDLHDARKRRIQKVLGIYAAAVREFSHEMLIAAHQENLRPNADGLSEITKTQLERRGRPVD